MFMNLVCIGTGFQIEAILREGHGTPTSLQCLDAVMNHWVSWAGYPKELTADRGLNNRGVFCKELSAAGVYCGNIGLEAPYQLGKVERHGSMWKQIAAKVIEEKHVVGFDAMRRMSMEVNAVVNEQNRTGGFSPAQWVLGRTPRYSSGEQGDDETAGQLGSLEQRDDPTTIFGERMSYQTCCEESIRARRLIQTCGFGITAKGRAKGWSISGRGPHLIPKGTRIRRYQKEPMVIAITYHRI